MNSIFKPRHDACLSNRLLRPSWRVIANLLQTLQTRLTKDGLPELIVAVARGGLVPAVWLSHKLNIEMFILTAKRHDTDFAYAKKQKPIIHILYQRSALRNKDILIVEDIMGTGETMYGILKRIDLCKPRRVRVATCYFNSANWHSLPFALSPYSIKYIGRTVNSWVVFPWEV